VGAPIGVAGRADRNFNFCLRLLSGGGHNRGYDMNIKTIALAGIFALSSIFAFAQSSQGKAGSDNGPTSNAPTAQNQGTAGGAEQNKGSSLAFNNEIADFHGELRWSQGADKGRVSG
jgi:hypothetical protein